MHRGHLCHPQMHRPKRRSVPVVFPPLFRLPPLRHTPNGPNVGEQKIRETNQDQTMDQVQKLRRAQFRPSRQMTNPCRRRGEGGPKHVSTHPILNGLLRFNAEHLVKDRRKEEQVQHQNVVGPQVFLEETTML